MSKLNNKTAFIFMTAALIVLIVIGTVLSRPDYTPAEKYMKKYFPDMKYETMANLLTHRIIMTTGLRYMALTVCRVI